MRPTAATWNAVIAAAKKVKQNNGGGLGKPSRGDFGIVLYGKNTTASLIARHKVVGISAITIDPAAAATQDTFQSTPVVDLRTPTLPNDSIRFGITMEPIAAGKVGRILVEGVAAIPISISDADHKFARVVDSSDTLASCAFGPVEILQVQSGTGTKYAVVRIGTCAGPRLFRATAAGSGGNVTAKPITKAGAEAAEEQSIPYLAHADMPIPLNDEFLLIAHDTNAEPIAIPFRGMYDSPKKIIGQESGTSDADAETDSWNVLSQGTDRGVQVAIPTRFYWSTVSGDPMYMFCRIFTYDSRGNLVSIGKETKYEMFDTIKVGV